MLHPNHTSCKGVKNSLPFELIMGNFCCFINLFNKIR